MSVQLTFSFRGDTGPIHEAQLVDLAAHRAAVLRSGGYGILQLAADGQPTAVIDDEVWHQLAHLCRCATELLAGYAAAVPYSRTIGGYDLAPEGEDTVLSGDGLPTVRMRTHDFATAVVACAKRYMQFAARLDDPQTSALADEVAGEAEPLRAVLAGE